MASPSSMPSRNWSHNVFTSFHGPDVRKTLLSHLREQFKRNGITMYDDQKIVRSAKIGPSLTEGIRGSRIAIVILSRKYASSSWCLDELVEILECKEAIGQIVMTIFYGVDPSEVRKQTGKFGIAFKKTCAGKTKKEKRKWYKALKHVSNIAGEDFFRWDNEAKMIEKIARDVSEKLNTTPSRDFDGMVGLGDHLRKMQYRLDLEYHGVMMVGIYGPAGIGKTTIARALYSQLSSSFPLTCFVDNLRESYHVGFDELGLKLCLQEQLLSNILNQTGIRICHLGVIKERLHNQRVLIILDDVNNIKQLEALAGDLSWFGPGSRIIVTTENKELLQQHGIDNTYHVNFPSSEEALEILCRSAFRQSFPHSGFNELAKRVTELCGNLPLGLSVVGSSLRWKNKDEWEEVIHRLESILYHQEIEEVLRVGYERLHENEQSLFLHIAVFFNYKDGDLVKAMLADKNSNIKHGLKILVNRSLICMSTNGEIVMHKLLQQVGTKVVRNEEPWKRRILIDASEICDVLRRPKEPMDVSGISFDISDIDEVSINKRAFKKVRNLRFLKVYKTKHDGNDRMHIPKDMEFPSRLRLLHWEAYPSKCLPPTFHLEYLVELNMQGSQLEYLWHGAQPLPNLKKMDLLKSYHLKELPDLSKATNLEELYLSHCESLVEIPSSFSKLHKLQKLIMWKCVNLQVIPAHLDLASLSHVYMGRCSRLKKIPVISTHIERLDIWGTAVEDVPPSIKLCSLGSLDLSFNQNLKEITYLPMNLVTLNLSYSGIETLPNCIKALQLHTLSLFSCRRLTSLPELPLSLKYLNADECESLETVICPFNTPYCLLSFTNCFKLSQQAQRAIVQQSSLRGTTFLPGRQVPGEFDHRARGNSLTIPLDFNRPLYIRFKVCIVISPKNHISGLWFQQLLLRRIVNRDLAAVDEEIDVGRVSKFRGEHLFVSQSCLLYIEPSQVTREIAFEFSRKSPDFDIVECGAQILTQDRTDEVICKTIETSGAWF